MPAKALDAVNRNAEMRGKKSCLCGKYILMKEDRGKNKNIHKLQSLKGKYRLNEIPVLWQDEKSLNMSFPVWASALVLCVLYQH